ncbi:hypothetical protein CALCODRAFT_301324 [Calocera cornea HHB12733]|uniref:Uncharacterized protein n=1 Tax=Calocera cornea HHB12733 TaxID=1353952 RepID=A0A165FI33_9BASI|nr:hypothetical protein CALCODRAFT_301324 [Calocera cornea HHB12733]
MGRPARRSVPESVWMVWARLPAPPLPLARNRTYPLALFPRGAAAMRISQFSPSIFAKRASSPRRLRNRSTHADAQIYQGKSSAGPLVFLFTPTISGKQRWSPNPRSRRMRPASARRGRMPASCPTRSAAMPSIWRPLTSMSPPSSSQRRCNMSTRPRRARSRRSWPTASSRATGQSPTRSGRRITAST